MITAAKAASSMNPGGSREWGSFFVDPLVKYAVNGLAQYISLRTTLFSEGSCRWSSGKNNVHSRQQIAAFRETVLATFDQPGFDLAKLSEPKKRLAKVVV
jgi:hypothetical protein